MNDAVKKSSPAKKATKKKASATKGGGAAKRTTVQKKSSAAKKPAVAKQTPSKKAGVNPAPPTRKGAAPETKAESAATSRFFKRAVERARRISDDPEKLREIADKANRSTALREGPFAAVLDDFRALIRLVVAYARGLYREIPADRLVIIVGGLIYVVSPIDLIPDMIPGGFLDDAAVIGYVLKAVRDELEAFREWEVGLTD